MFTFLFNPISLDEAFELLIENRIFPKEFKQASRKINRLKDDDWRLWFGRFLLSLRSDAEGSYLKDAFVCLEITLDILKNQKDPEKYKKFLSLINNPALFFAYKFYYEADGTTVTALLLARAYQNGWGVKKDLGKAFEIVKAATKNESDEFYPAAQELLNEFLLERSDSAN